jgi:hypothetical protein
MDDKAGLLRLDMVTSGKAEKEGIDMHMRMQLIIHNGYMAGNVINNRDCGMKRDTQWPGPAYLNIALQVNMTHPLTQVNMTYLLIF